ncbi:MAG TPA: thioredoxin domain-containing protein [Thermoanaerobaculia bacterium]|nr:thioredoxin domain-containing protein [Thermoanaerobaculia bacterium]
MKRTLLFCAFLLATVAAQAAEVDPKLEKAIRDSLPVCEGAKVTFGDLQVALPPRFKGTLVKVESANHYCDQQAAGIVSPAGSFYFGMPWPLAEETGTIEEKLKGFVWRNFQMNVTPVVDRKATADGLYNVVLQQATEYGKLPMEGEIDPEGKVFFFGHFRRGDDVRASRVKAFDSLLAKSPARGPANAKVTIIEFSDFECPSCKRASGYLDPILAKHDGNVRYIRFDMPLTGHPWAFPAAFAGRAIHKQKPELFWEYKKQVYANQEKLNAFTFWDWARGFAEENELDLKQYDADVASEELKNEILKGAGLALSNEVRSTPTYIVNGAMVEAGSEGKALAEYVENLLK